MKTLLVIAICILTFNTAKSQIVFGNYTALDNKYGNIGSLHNKVLENCYLNMPIPDRFNYENAVSYIADYNQTYLTSVAKSSTYFDTKQISSEFQIRKYYVNKKTFKEQLLDTNNPNSIDGIGNQLSKYPILGDKNKLVFAEISDAMKSNLMGNLSNDLFEKKIVDIYNNFENNGDNLGRDLIGEIVTISLLSCEWWRKNPNAADEPKSLGGKGGPSSNFLDESSPYVVPVAAMDAAGALVSAGAVALNNYINNGSISWSAVGTGAVIGAVTGSTGIVGKVGKWIASLF